MLQLAFIAPELIEKILAGHQPADMNRQKLLRLKALPIVWSDQRKMLGM